MKINLIALATPFFLLLMGIEYLISRFRAERSYHLSDFANNISCGVLEQVCCLPVQGVLMYSYYYLYQNFSFFNIHSTDAFAWVLLWLGVDFFYYWFHRASHRNTFLWVGHSVHHQSEQYNLSVALRQGMLQTLCSWVVYLPLALVGFPAEMFLTVSSLITLYQFWIHTKLISRLGWFEIIFNSPSHHRVHHGKNVRYIDKNYGGSLIIWDKLFGTYEQESIPVEYGTTEPLNSWNPFYANVKTMADAFYYGRYLERFWDKILMFFRPPEWIAHHLGAEKMQQLKFKRKGRKTSQVSILYIFFNLALIITSYSYYLVMYTPQDWLSWLVGLLSVLTVYQIGCALNEGLSRKVKLIEWLRLILIFMMMEEMFQSNRLSFLMTGLLVACNWYAQTGYVLLREEDPQSECGRS